MSKILETMQKAQEVQPIGEKDGVKVVTFEDAVALNDADMLEPKQGVRTRAYNPDGTLARTSRMTTAMNVESYFINRFKLKAKKLNVVVDYRAIKEQATGACYLKQIPCYVFGRDEANNLVLEKVTTVGDTEFISDYINTLEPGAMAQLLPLIAAHGTNQTTSELPI